MNAKTSNHSGTIGRRDHAGRRWLRPADSSSKCACGNDSSGSRRHNSEIVDNSEDSGEEDRHGGEKLDRHGADDANPKIQLRPGNGHWRQSWSELKKAIGGSGSGAGVARTKGRYVWGKDTFDRAGSPSRTNRNADRGQQEAAGTNAAGCGFEQSSGGCVSRRK